MKRSSVSVTMPALRKMGVPSSLNFLALDSMWRMSHCNALILLEGRWQNRPSVIGAFLHVQRLILFTTKQLSKVNCCPNQQVKNKSTNSERKKIPQTEVHQCGSGMFSYKQNDAFQDAAFAIEKFSKVPVTPASLPPTNNNQHFPQQTTLPTTNNNQHFPQQTIINTSHNKQTFPQQTIINTSHNKQ